MTLVPAMFSFLGEFTWGADGLGLHVHMIRDCAFGVARL